MDEIKDFESFYTIKLEPLLSNLKLQQKEAATWANTALVSGLLALLSFIGNIMDYLDSFGGGWPAIFFTVLLIISIYQYTKKKDLYTDNFKETIIRQII